MPQLAALNGHMCRLFFNQADTGSVTSNEASASGAASRSDELDISSAQASSHSTDLTGDPSCLVQPSRLPSYFRMCNLSLHAHSTMHMQFMVNSPAARLGLSCFGMYIMHHAADAGAGSPGQVSADSVSTPAQQMPAGTVSASRPAQPVRATVPLAAPAMLNAASSANETAHGPVAGSPQNLQPAGAVMVSRPDQTTAPLAASALQIAQVPSKTSAHAPVAGSPQIQPLGTVTVTRPDLAAAPPSESALNVASAPKSAAPAPAPKTGSPVSAGSANLLPVSQGSLMPVVRHTSVKVPLLSG